MESLKKNKILLTVFGISLVAFLFYQFSGTFKSSVVDIVEVNPVDEAATAEILTLLTQMQQAKIDSELFTSSAWTSLIDYSIPLPNDVRGRPDLFGPTFRSTPSQVTVQP